jgi:vancomycin resistance protein YoaR
MPVDKYHQQYGPVQRRRTQQSARPPENEPAAPPPPPRPPRPARRRLNQRRKNHWWLVLLSLPILFLVSLLALPYVLNLVYRDQALPGVRIQGVPVTGMDRATISTILTEQHGDFLAQPVDLVYADQVWRPTLNELGIQLNIETVSDMAVSAGRHGDPLTRLREIRALSTTGIEIAPRLSVDQQTLQQYLLQLATAIEQAPEDAALSIADARVIGSPSIQGVQLMVDATANDLLLALQDLAPQAVTIRTRELAPDIGDNALVTTQNQVVALLQHPLILRHNDEEFVWDAARRAELLRITGNDGQLAVQIDEALLAQAVDGLAQQVDSGTAEPRLRFVEGEVRIIEPGQPGWRLDQAAAVEQIGNLLLQTAATTTTVDLPVDPIEPRITAENIAGLGITELVGEGRSSFVGSAQYRITNINAGARRMDGVLIAPGEEFSFNRQLGAVDAENGFVEGYAIIGNRTQLEWGGGVCQDSTTVFRAAFWAGLPITERHAHAFYISWYDRFGLGPYGDGQGLDAAIYTGVNDLKFVNDTGNWLLMQTEVDEAAQILTVRLYGTRPDREVVLEGPYIENEVAAPSQPVYIDDPSLPQGTVRQSDVARSGRDITIYRLIIEDGEEVRRDIFTTRFKPWPNIYLRGTGS